MSHEPWTPVKYCYTVGCVRGAEPDSDYCIEHELPSAAEVMAFGELPLGPSRCAAAGCVFDAEPNLALCRGHEGGFLVGDPGRTVTMQSSYETPMGQPLPEPTDEVHRPAHYTKGAIECIDAITEAVKDLKGVEAFAIGNAIKYLWRHDMKGGTQDLEKAKWYIDRCISERTKRGAK